MTQQPPEGRETILVVEDVPLLRKLFDRVLSTAGYRVLLAASGSEAVEIWARDRDSIALVITDAMMPGMPGAELVAGLRAERAELPAIGTSGYTRDDLVERAALPEQVVFIEKPVRSSC